MAMIAAATSGINELTINRPHLLPKLFFAIGEVPLFQIDLLGDSLAAAAFSGR